MKAEPLEFPRGVRFPRIDEVPAQFEKEYGRIANARITTGYVRSTVDMTGYSDVIEANVHASRIWEVFRELVEAIVPEAAAPIVGVKDEEPILGKYTTRDAALAALEPYREQLQHDGFLEFGIIFQRAGRTEEVFVRNVKYFQIWTNKPGEVLRVLTAHGIPEVLGLQFIDDYPRVSEALPYDDQSSGWHGLIESINASFESLPEPPDGDA